MIDTDKAWSIYSTNGLTFAEAMGVASNIVCFNGTWDLNTAPHVASAAQLVLGLDIFDYLCSDTTEGQIQYFARKGAYDRIRDALEALYPAAPGNVTDPWTADTYSELYKDRCGFRPRLNISGPEMRAYIMSCRSEDLD